MLGRCRSGSFGQWLLILHSYETVKCFNEFCSRSISLELFPPLNVEGCLKLLSVSMLSWSCQTQSTWPTCLAKNVRITNFVGGFCKVVGYTVEDEFAVIYDA